jgi:murein L,D-transpeptidase YafK
VKYRSLCGALFGVVLTHAQAGEDSPARDIWLAVDTRPHLLTVMEGDKPVEIFEKIAIGRRGSGYQKSRGDDKTPLGNYRIGWVNENSRYHRFYGFSYPNRDNAERAFQSGLIGPNAYQSILRASAGDSIPPQDTALGGQIGIHGLGSANPRVHQIFDWTHGCIAMTNEQIDRLSHWIRRGTLVVVREMSQNKGGNLADFTAN